MIKGANPPPTIPAKVEASDAPVTEAGRKLLDDEGCLTGEAKCQDRTTPPTIRKAREKRHGERVEGRAYE